LLSACEKDEPVSADPSVPEAPSGTTVKVNFADSGLPVLNIKRGYLLRDAISSSNNKIKSDLQAYADMVYGYCFFTGAQNYSMMNAVFTFLNNMPQARKTLSDVPEGLKYIASADENKISIVLWNPEYEHYVFNLDTTNGTKAATNLTIEKGSETNLVRIVSTTSGAAKKIDGLRLNSQEFLLITIAF
jgi:hypothetical protein